MNANSNKRRWCRGLLTAVFAAILLRAVPGLAQTLPCPDTNQTKFILPPQTQQGFDVYDGKGVVLANNFFCNSMGPISDIHIWGSWLNDQIGTITNFWLGIYDDVPAVTNAASGQVMPSHPGTNLLWNQFFGPGQFSQNLYTNGSEYFFDARNNTVILGGDTMVWYYCFYPTNPFVQQGTPAFPTNYWLAAHAGVVNPTNFIYGWKTSTLLYNDTAAWVPATGGMPITGAPWTPFYNPFNTNQPINLSFKLNTPSNAPVTCVETDQVKYVQGPNLNNGFDVWNSSSKPPGVADGPWVLADDFVCTNTGPITDIHLWGSWFNDQPLPGAITFWLGVYDDVPVNATNSNSHPGNLLWQEYFAPGQYAEQPNNFGQEQFLDPGPPQILGPESQVWYYCFYPTGLTQTGSVTMPKIYWLSAFATLPAGTSQVYGWKTTTNVQHDISVHEPWPGFGPPNNAGWIPTLQLPTGGPLDLAFKIDTTTNQCGLTISCPQSKTVECASNWMFDPPTATNPCCPVAPTITFQGVITNSTDPCEQMYTAGWLITDCAGNRGICTQQVTVVGLLVVTCPTNKTVQCGSIWSFDPPTAYDACCGSNLTIRIINTETNGSSCSNLITRTWFVTDCCSNTGTVECRQTVTVVDATPPSLTVSTNIVVYSCTNATVSWSNTATDLCNSVTITSVPPSPATFPPNTTNTVIVTATDACGNSTNGSFTVAVICSNTNPPVTCVETDAVKYVQWPMLTNGFDVWNSSAKPPGDTNGPWVLADDFVCTNAGPITDIHIWGSWLNDQVLTNSLTFWLGVYDDVPTNVDNHFSHPGNLLWQQYFSPGQYAEQFYAPGQENFLDPGPPILVGPDSQVWYYCFYPTGLTQTGSVTLPKTYWLAAFATSLPGTPNVYGWKTTTNVQHDVSVHEPWPGFGPPNNNGWVPTTEPIGPAPVAVDLAFKITTTTNTPPPTSCVETDAVKYVQGPNVNGGYDVWNSTAIPPGVTDGPWVLADDFVCTNTGPISDIHIWGSWLYDNALPTNIRFWLGVYDDVPVNATNTYSHPGNLLWQEYFSPGQYAELIYTNGDEQFLDPGPPAIIGADTLVWYYCFYPSNLVQYGSTSNPKTYWLSVFAQLPTGITNVFGWKTTTNVQHDISVHAQWPGLPPPNTPWLPTMLPTGQPLDLAFKLSTVTNRCPIPVACSVNKTVECGTNWTFDPPIVGPDPCCPSPPTVTLRLSGTNYNGQCAQIAYAVWDITDCFGQSVACTQIVTIVDAPPSITCSTNKTVACGSLWSFDEPTASSACCGTNVTITVLSTVTNGSCPSLVTRTWLATDCCTNTNTCSQTVTVVDTTPPSLTVPTNFIVYTCSTNIVVSWSITATDVCSSVTVTSSPPSPATFLADTTNTVSVTATDGCGNSTNKTFTVTVLRPVLGNIMFAYQTNHTVILTWSNGILEMATNVLGPYSDVAGATSPYTNAALLPAKFYRLRCLSP